MVRGEKVNNALVVLENTPKKATHVLTKLINSAIANAEHNDKSKKDDLYIKSIEVNDGFTMKRIRPVSRGAAHPYRKRTSNVTLELGVKDAPKAKKAAAKKAAKKSAPKAAAKKAPAKKAAKKAAPKAKK